MLQADSVSDAPVDEHGGKEHRLRFMPRRVPVLSSNDEKGDDNYEQDRDEKL